MFPKTLGDLLGSCNTTQIRCLYKDTVVRTLHRRGANVVIESEGHPSLTMPLATPLFYEPWCMDRGSILFEVEDEALGGVAKICTELDIVVFPNGSRFSIQVNGLPQMQKSGQRGEF